VLPVIDMGRCSVKTHITASNSTATFVAVEFETPDLPTVLAALILSDQIYSWQFLLFDFL
jgi:hypothetical protein